MTKARSGDDYCTLYLAFTAAQGDSEWPALGRPPDQAVPTYSESQP